MQTRKLDSELIICHEGQQSHEPCSHTHTQYVPVFTDLELKQCIYSMMMMMQSPHFREFLSYIKGLELGGATWLMSG